jgi:hypothetical protein
LWADLIWAKYLRDRDLFASEVPTQGSQFWRAIQKVKWLFKLGARHLVHNGKRTFFWQDWWTGSGPLHARFPVLFGCCDQSFVMLHGAHVLGGEPGAWHLHFRRQFGLAEAVEWENLCRENQELPSSPEDDQTGWRLEPSGQYSTIFMYRSLARVLAVTFCKDVWKMRIPPKIRIFLWQLIWGKLPCSEQVAKRRGPSNGLCTLCGETEDCDHIFFPCHMAQFMWVGIREILHWDWNPAGAGGFVALAPGLSGPFRRLSWFAFTAMFWTLWNVRNKLTIELVNSSKCLYTCSIGGF